MWLFLLLSYVNTESSEFKARIIKEILNEVIPWSEKNILLLSPERQQNSN